MAFLLGSEPPRSPEETPVDQVDTVPTEPSTPSAPTPLPLTQDTLPSTEIPDSPINATQDSVKTEEQSEAPGASRIIPSSLTPPPSSQAPGAADAGPRPTITASQEPSSSLFSPPATIRPLGTDRLIGSNYVSPPAHRILSAPVEDLRGMLHKSNTEIQRLKMEVAHYKLQHQLLTIQSEEDSKRAAVEHEMIEREVAALRSGEQRLQVRRELSAATDAHKAKYLEMKGWFDEALAENEALKNRLRTAKRVIQDKEEENINLRDSNKQLLNRIRENREHFQSMCNPGGIFHNIMSPKVQQNPSSQQSNYNSRFERRGDIYGGQGLDALLEAASQDNNYSAPTTPRATAPMPRYTTKHSRNAQSLSSLPTTPLSKIRGGLLPSANLEPQTEPRWRTHSGALLEPSTPTAQVEQGRKSRESTISADDNEELARQALYSVATAAASLAPQDSQASFVRGMPYSRVEGTSDREVYGSQASQAATELLRHDSRSDSGFVREDASTAPIRSPNLKAAGPGKRKASSQIDSPKRPKVSRPSGNGRQVGLGIQGRK